MKTVPMLFQTDLVRALLDGRKTVTRRPLEVTPGWEIKDRKPTKITSSHPKKGKWGALIRKGTFDDKYQHDLVAAPCFVDDLIYVRETFAALGHNDYQQVNPRNISEIHEYRYKASERESIANCQDHEVRGYKWVPSIHMPRHASRLTLKVTDVRIEAMKELRQNPEQVIREGFGSFPQFRHTWREIYGQCEPDDLVWVIEFEVIHKNVEQVISEMKVTA
ncbi:ASCH domain-containing protein [Vibrio parahaemolyticus]|nr:ASCH domain-containing protein [Vibrio parahaemolyticus]